MPLDMTEYTPKKRIFLKSKAKVAVYVVSDETEKPCKIGYATDVPARLVAMQTGNWRPLFVQFLLWTPGSPVASRVEQTAHERLGAHRIGGEWFNVSAAEIKSQLNKLVVELYPTIRFFEHHETIEYLRKVPIDKRDHVPAA